MFCKISLKKFLHLGPVIGIPFMLLMSLSQCTDIPNGTGGFGTINMGLSVGGQQNSPEVFATIDSLSLDSVKINLGRIRFVSSVGDSLDFRLDSAMIVNLAVNGTVFDLGSINVPAGVYEESRFRVFKLDSSNSGTTYLNNPDMRGVSIRVDGYVNGMKDSTFVWTTDLNDELVQRSQPFTVTDGNTVNVVFRLDVNSWFSDGAGGELDPRIGTTGNTKSVIEDNIKNSFDLQFQL